MQPPRTSNPIVDRNVVFAKRDRFGRTLFSGSRFIFWSVGPILVLSGIAFPFLMEPTPVQIGLSIVASIFCFLLALGLYDPRRFRWALRGVTFIVFLASVAYVVDEVFIPKHPVQMADSRSQASPKNAIKFFIVAGLPSLAFTVFGRFREPELASAPELSGEPVQKEV